MVRVCVGVVVGAGVGVCVRLLVYVRVCGCGCRRGVRACGRACVCVGLGAALFFFQKKVFLFFITSLKKFKKVKKCFKSKLYKNSGGVFSLSFEFFGKN